MAFCKLFFGTLVLLSLSASCGRNVASGNRSSHSTDVGGSVQVSPSGANAGEPAIAGDENGNLYVLWVDQTNKSNADLLLQRFDSAAKPIGEKVRVNPEGLAVKSWFGDPPTIAIGRDGAVYVGWNRAYPDAKGNDLVISASRDRGATFDAPVKVNDDSAPASHGMHSLAVGDAGRIFVAWLDERNVKISEPSGGHHEGAEPNSEVFYSWSDDGGNTFGPNIRLASEVCPCCKTSLLPAGDDRVYVAWRQVLPGEFRHIAVAHSIDGGRTFSNGVIVSDDRWQINACPVSGAALSAARDGALTVAWYTAGEGQPGIYTARSTDGGETFTPRNIFSNEAASGMPTFLTTPTGSSIVFATNGSVKLSDAGGASAPTSLADGLYPAATATGGRKYACYVRKAGDGGAVWLTSIGG